MITVKALLHTFSIFIGLMSLSTIARAAAISIVGLQDTSHISATGFTVDSKSGAGGGILLNGHFGNSFGIETGALAFERSWTDSTSASGTSTLSGTVIEIPLTIEYRFWRHFSIGVGGYYSSCPGTLKETGATTNNALNYSAYGIKNSDYGGVADFSLQMHLYSATFFRAEYRYTVGGPNLTSTSGDTFKNRDSQILVGLTFAIGKGGGSTYDKSER